MAVIGALLAVGYTYEAAGDGRTRARILKALRATPVVLRVLVGGGPMTVQ